MATAFIHPGAIGDLVLALPVAQSLAAAGESVELLAAGDRASLFAGRSAFAVGHSLDSLPLWPLFSESAGPADAAFLQRFERIVCGYPSETLLANLRRLCRGRIDALDVRPANIAASGQHASDFLHRQLFATAAPLPVMQTEDCRTRTTGRPHAIIHPGSGGRGKCWPIACFRETADLLASAGWAITFILGPAERERQVCPPIGSARIRVLGSLSLTKLREAICSADVYLGNDSGPTHLAAALGLPTVAIFGPTDPRVWGPRGRAVSIMAGVPARGPDWAIRPADVAGMLIRGHWNVAQPPPAVIAPRGGRTGF